MLIGLGIIALIGAGSGFALFSMSGSKWKSLIGTGDGGMVGIFVWMFTDTWSYIVACAGGDLGLPGYLFLISGCLVIVIYSANGLLDVMRGRAFNPVK